MITKFDVSPFDGLLPIRLGMSAAEMAAVLGVSPGRPLKTAFGFELNFILPGSQLVKATISDDKAVEITISPGPIPVLFESVKLLESGMEREALAVLLQKQADPRESYGTLIFDRLGIAVGGLHDEDIENKSLSVFARGHWRNIADLPFADLRV